MSIVCDPADLSGDIGGRGPPAAGVEPDAVELAMGMEGLRRPTGAPTALAGWTPAATNSSRHMPRGVVSES